MNNKLVKYLLYCLGFIPYFIQLYFSKPWLFALRKYWDYSTLDRQNLFSIYNVKGVIIYIFPFLLNELAVWIVVWAIFQSKSIFKQYFNISLIFWTSTIGLRIISQYFEISFLERFTYGFFYLGTSPLWLLTWLFFFTIQTKRLEKKAS